MEHYPRDPASFAELRIEIIRSSVRDSKSEFVRDSEYRVRITNGAIEEAEDPFRIPLSAWEIEAARDASSSSPVIQRSWATQTADFTMDVGARLFDSLFA